MVEDDRFPKRKGRVESRERETEKRGGGGGETGLFFTLDDLTSARELVSWTGR